MRKLVFLMILLWPALAFGRGFGDFGSESFRTTVPANTVLGSGSSTDEALARWDGTTGTLLQDSGVLLSDTDVMTGLEQLVIGAGPAAGDAAIDIQTTDSVLLLSRLDNTQEAGLTELDGMLYYNTTDGEFKFREGGTWHNLGSGGGGITGPVSSTDNAVMVWDGVGGNVAKDSTLIYNEPPAGANSAGELKGAAGLEIEFRTWTATSPAEVVLAGAPGDDLLVDTDVLVVESDSDQVGVGTTDPQVKMHVLAGGTVAAPKGGTVLSVQDTSSAASTAHITMHSGNASISSLFWADTDATTPGRIDYDHAANQMGFGTDSVTTQMYIESDGDVHIQSSTPAPTAALEVTSTTRGFLTTRVTTLQRDAIGAGDCDTGLMVMNTDLDEMQYCLSDDTWRSMNQGNVAGPGTSTKNHFALYADGTGKTLKNAPNHIIEGGTGDLGIRTLTPQATVHMSDGGSTTTTQSDVLIVERSGGSQPAGVTILGGSTSGSSTLYLGDDADTDVGSMQYLHASDTLVTTVATNTQMTMGDGRVGMPTLETDAALAVASTTGAFIPPRMDNTQRDALTASAGMIVYSTTDNCTQEYNGTEWGCLDNTLPFEAAFGSLKMYNETPPGETVDTTADQTMFDWVDGEVDSNGIVTITGVEKQLTVNAGGAGVYRVYANVSMDATSVPANQAYVLEMFNNGVLDTDCRAAAPEVINQTLTMGFDCFTSLAVNDDIDIRLRVTTGTETVMIGGASLTLWRME